MDPQPPVAPGRRRIAAWMASSSVRARLFLLSGLVLGAIAVLALGSLWAVRTIVDGSSAANEELTEEAIPLLNLAYDVTALTEEITAAVASSDAGDQGGVSFEDRIAAIERQISTLVPGHSTSERAILNDGVSEWRAGLAQLPELQEDSDRLLALVMVLSPLHAAAASFHAAHDAAIDDAAVHLSAAEEARSRILIAIVLLAGLAFLITAVVLYEGGRSIVRPVRRLRAAALRVAAGESLEPLSLDGPQELADLASAFNEMTTQIQGRVEDLRHHALHDDLTGLGNRALLRQRLTLGLAQTGRFGGVISLLLIDLDHFKKVNDGAGHAAGDTVLVTVAQRLTSVLDESSEVIRLGGDEFAVVMDASADAACIIAEQVLAAVRAPVALKNRLVAVTASIGLATAYGEMQAEDLLREADLAMYAAKDGGRDQVCVYVPEAHHPAADRLEIEEDLARAIADGDLDVHYQPVVDLFSRAVAGVEALVRWEHLEHGPLPPGRFIPVAEDSGLIDGLGRHVLRTALRDARGWLEEFPSDTFTVAVNVSGHQLQDAEFAERVLDDVEASGLPTQHLILEITETVLVNRADRALSQLRRLRAAGIRIALDDFGTGYTSFEYLGNFPIDEIKIDRAFVADLSRKAGHANIVRSIVGLARDFGAYVVAEGVESEGDAAALRDLGCRLAQGFLFHRPTPASIIHGLLRDGSESPRQTSVVPEALSRAS